MALIKPDFSESTDTVGPGTYKVRVTDAKMDKWAGKDGGKDTPYVNWTLETFDEAEQKNNGRRVWLKTPVAGKGVFRLKDLYKAATREELDGEFDTDQLLGKEVQVTMAERNGYVEVKTIAPIM